MKPFFQLSALGAAIGTMDLRVGALAARGLRQMRTLISVLYAIVLDFGIFFICYSPIT